MKNLILLLLLGNLFFSHTSFAQQKRNVRLINYNSNDTILIADSSDVSISVLKSSVASILFTGMPLKEIKGTLKIVDEYTIMVDEKSIPISSIIFFGIKRNDKTTGNVFFVLAATAALAGIISYSTNNDKLPDGKESSILLPTLLLEGVAVTFLIIGNQLINGYEKFLLKSENNPYSQFSFSSQLFNIEIVKSIE